MTLIWETLFTSSKLQNIIIQHILEVKERSGGTLYVAGKEGKINSVEVTITILIIRPC